MSSGNIDISSKDNFFIYASPDPLSNPENNDYSKTTELSQQSFHSMEPEYPLKLVNAVKNLSTLLENEEVDIAKAAKLFKKISNIFVNPGEADEATLMKMATFVKEELKPYEKKLKQVTKQVYKKVHREERLSSESLAETSQSQPPGQRLGLDHLAQRLIAEIPKKYPHQSLTIKQVVSEIEFYMKHHGIPGEDKVAFIHKVLEVIGTQDLMLIALLTKHYKFNGEEKLKILRYVCENHPKANNLFSQNAMLWFGIREEVALRLLEDICKNPDLLIKMSVNDILDSMMHTSDRESIYRICLINAPGEFFDSLSKSTLEQMKKDDPRLFESLGLRLSEEHPHIAISHIDLLLSERPGIKAQFLLNLAARVPALVPVNIHKFQINDPNILLEAACICGAQKPFETINNIKNFKLTPSHYDQVAAVAAQGLLELDPYHILDFLKSIEMSLPGDFRLFVANHLIMKAPEILAKNIKMFQFMEITRVDLAEKLSILAPGVFANYIEEFEIQDPDKVEELKVRSHIMSMRERQASPFEDKVVEPAHFPIASSSTEVPKKAITDFATAMTKGYQLLFPGFIADCFTQFTTPRIEKALDEFRNSGLKTARYSKKIDPYFPLGFRFKRRKNGDIILEIHSGKQGLLGSGYYNKIKKSHQILIDENNQCIERETVLRRNTIRSGTTAQLRGARLHRQILKEVKAANPGQKIYLSPKMSISTYQPADRKKSMRSEMSQKPFAGSLDVVDKSRFKNPISLLRMFIKIAEGVKSLTNAGYVHKDLKSENILVSKKGTPYISDFDLTQKIGLSDTRTQYWAWDDLTEMGVVTPNCDVFGLVLSAAIELIPNFTGVIPIRNDIKIALRRHLKNPANFLKMCLSAPPEHPAADKLELMLRMGLTPAELDWRLTKEFPVEYGVIKLLVKELENSQKLYEHIREKNKAPEDLAEWKKVVDELGLTTPEKLVSEFGEILTKASG